MLILLSYVGIFLCSVIVEVGWIWSVRSVSANRDWLVVGNAIVMQGISNLSTLILVQDSRTSLASIAGAAVGALVGMRLSARAFSAVKPRIAVL